MKAFFLGTNGWYDTGTGSTICTLIDASRYYIVLDAGNGIYKADRYIKKDKPVYLFLSHFHIDHIEGLHILTKFDFKSLRIFGQPGTKKALTSFLDKKFSVPLDDLPYPAKVTELKEGWHNVPFKVQCLELVHASRCFGYRFELDGRVVSYCMDTGPCREAVELSRNADLLISECAFRSGMDTAKWPHLTPETAAGIAKKADAGKLVMTHFDANVYRTARARASALEKARKIFPQTMIASDGFSCKILAL